MKVHRWKFNQNTGGHKIMFEDSGTPRFGRSIAAFKTKPAGLHKDTNAHSQVRHADSIVR